jgi:DNA-binding response OmpR family regulator
MSGITDVAGRTLAAAGRDDVAATPASDRGTLLAVVPAHDGRSLAIVGYLLPPGRLPAGGPGDAAEPVTERVPAGLLVDRDQHRVLLGGREIELVYQEFELLEFLTAHPHRAFTREQIIAGAWSNVQQATNRTVDVHIHRLRRKLGPGYARHLVTVRRVGYMYRPPAIP